jgi:hypothetical protein
METHLNVTKTTKFMEAKLAEANHAQQRGNGKKGRPEQT